MHDRPLVPALPFEGAQMLTYAEAAALLKVDKRTVRRRVADGRYIAYGDGSGKRFLYSSILADIQRNCREGAHGQT